MAHEFDGKKYQKASAHQKEWGNKIIAEFELKGNEHILDLGCGDGVLTAQLATLVPDGFVMGIDSSRSMIETAQDLATSNLAFRVQDINELDFENQFDLVFSNATLHWVKDHRLLLKNVLRCLTDGGYLRFNFAAEGNCSHFIKIAKEAMARAEYAERFSSFEWPWYMPDVKTYESLVLQSSFKEVEVWGENADRYFPDVDAMVKWVEQPSLVPLLAILSESEKPKFRDYVVKRMIEVTLQSDGTCFETFRRINVRARK
jgi:trans-aconitate methyltransferase